MLPVQVDKLLRDKVKLLHLQLSEKTLGKKGRNILKQYVSQLKDIRHRL